MKKHTTTKLDLANNTLTLRKEVIRTLQSEDLAKVVGGFKVVSALPGKHC